MANAKARWRQNLASLAAYNKAMVWGECPSLLNEDSGGCARLDIEIEDAIKAAKGAV